MEDQKTPEQNKPKKRKKGSLIRCQPTEDIRPGTTDCEVAAKIGIRPLGTEYYGRLVEIWAGAVQATHHFLSEEDFNHFHARIASDYLPAAALYGAFSAQAPQHCLGFMGLARESDGAPLRVEMLFVDPAAHRRGIGRALLNHAKSMAGAVILDVNEQNSGAAAFYLSQGFETIGRSPLDPSGRPYPLLHLYYKNNCASK